MPPWSDQVAGVQRQALSAFGERDGEGVGVAYTFASGATQESVEAIFRSTFSEIDPQTEVAVQTVAPNLKVMTEDLLEEPRGGTGQLGDEADQVVVRGKTYRVQEVEHDEANGWAVLILTLLGDA